MSGNGQLGRVVEEMFEQSPKYRRLDTDERPHLSVLFACIFS